ncbi:MAG: hypothetical protein K2P84_01865 [Undibacterium sp.]|nr:hypothetical protein [Undibacterium sp.]
MKTIDHQIFLADGGFARRFHTRRQGHVLCDELRDLSNAGKRGLALS